MKSNNYRIFEEDSLFVRTPIHSNVINMLGNSYCSRIMTNFNFKVLKVDIFFSLSKMQVWENYLLKVHTGGTQYHFIQTLVRFLSQKRFFEG